MRGMQGLQDMRASAVEPVRGRENLDVAGRDADGGFAAGQRDSLGGFGPDVGGVELNALPIHGELGGLATSASTAPTAAGRRDVHGHAATGSASASRATTTAHGQRVLRAHFRALLAADRSEEHTSELQSHLNLVCRLLLEKKKKHRKS